MTSSQLLALLEQLKTDSALADQLKTATDLDTAVSIARQAGFDVKKEDWLEFRMTNDRPVEISDRELESVAGGSRSTSESGCKTGGWCDCSY